jgi:sulfoxide reductase heme-binding subunit YedZ
MRAGLEGVGLLANSTGFLSFFVLWIAIIWGIVLRNGWASTRIRHSTAAGIHTTIALFGLSLGVIHALAVEAGRGEHIRLVDVVVPFADKLPFGPAPEPYFNDTAATPVDRLGVTVGVIGLEVVLAIAVSILIQRRLGYRRWRALHGLAYAAFLLIVAHIVIVGPGTGSGWIQVTVLACCAITLVLWLGSPLWAAIADSRLGRAMSMAHGGQAMMTVNVDTLRCQRSGFCVQTAPAVFRMHGDGRLTYRASVDATNVEAAIRAAETCPTRAIVVGLAPTSVTTSQPHQSNGRGSRPRSSSQNRSDWHRGSR